MANDEQGHIHMSILILKKPHCDIPYTVQGYAIRSKFLKQSSQALLGIFLTWHSCGWTFVADSITAILEQQFRLEPHKFPVQPSPITIAHMRSPQTFNTHADMETVNLVTSGGVNNMVSVTLWEGIISAIPSASFIRGLVLCTCGPTGYITNSVILLKMMKDLNIFDFVLIFSVVVPP
ncbi:hypothetical protein DEU56DRAFT_754121 [Suillus clintonianus]|uniref:uncharacterized protein n=1 Tax=Suillus clintonianus TaxID=1904413 RepID=UPI001B876EC2|nr:uncharacterized protein DEU56DRAFT_754121 [Suillus clintonianus]KAG2145263.1 hypothetical protein DEU56DRAFT_754121 [Suillus clintonianus]